ncbi:MAG: DUF2079 domain-containing protein, partial [Bifidobacteriaceae bacterium]|nr:DUF2079 domain-containing protein [Bifidobacteriaceae bacterium]
DLAIFEQVVKGWANSFWPVVDIKGPGFVQFGDHFSPLLVVLAPFYRMFPSPVTLLVAQALLIAISAVPIGGLARRILGLGRWQSVALTAAYTVSWGFQTAVASQFHEYCLAVPLLALALAWLVDGRWLAAAICAGLLIGVKEDLVFTTGALGLMMIGLARWRSRKIKVLPDGSRLVAGLRVPPGGLVRGIWLAAVSAGAAVLIFLVVMPLFNPQGSWAYWGRLPFTGASDQNQGGPGDALWAFISGFAEGDKWWTLALLVAVTAGAGLFSPLAVLALPTLAWRFISPNEFYWGTDWHYSMILMPIVFAAAIQAVGRWRQSPRWALRGYAQVAVPVLAVAVATWSVFTFPLRQIFEPIDPASKVRAEAGREVLALIPPGSSVATDIGLITRLTKDHTVYWIGEDLGDIRPDYVLVDPAAGWSRDPGLANTYAESLYGGHYELVQPADGASISPFRLAHLTGG